MQETKIQQLSVWDELLVLGYHRTVVFWYNILITVYFNIVFEQLQYFSVTF